MNIKVARRISVIILAAVLSGFLTATAVSGAEATVRRYVITGFGAVGDGHTVNTKAIQAVIDRCAAGGGGVVVVPPGTFLTGALFFKQGVNLLVERGGVLKSTTNPDEFPQIRTRWEGSERTWRCAFLNFENMTDVTVTGEGTIDGSGGAWLKRLGMHPRSWSWGPDRTPPPTAAERAAWRRQWSAGGRKRGGTQLERPQLMLFSGCDSVRISGLRLERQAVWCLHLLFCQDVDVDHVTIRAIDRVPSSDGIDVDSCNDVRITDCDISDFDDDISIKSGKNAAGRLVNRPSENITISDCTIRTGGGIAMGSEVSGSIRHVLVEHCRFIDTDSAARIKSQPSRGGVIEDIVYRDIQLDHVLWMIDFNLAWNLRPPVAPAAPVLTVARDIRLINYSGTAELGGHIIGLKGSPFRDLKFVNCHVTARKGLILKNTTDLGLSGLDLKVAEGPAIIRSNGKGRP